MIGIEIPPAKSFLSMVSQKCPEGNLGKKFLYALPTAAHTIPESKEKEAATMNCHANKSIECTVQQCANHCEGENYCSLDRILVGTHEACPTVDQCTDCMSFRKK
jgi:cobalamin biosynthesis Co2+ chelatase CbiK